MARFSNLILEFNRERDEFRSTALTAKGTTIPAVLQLCERLKDLLVQSELDNAVLRGKLQAFQEGAATTSDNQSRNEQSKGPQHQEPPRRVPPTSTTLPQTTQGQQSRPAHQTTRTTAQQPGPTTQTSQQRAGYTSRGKGKPKSVVQLQRTNPNQEEPTPSTSASRSYAEAVKTTQAKASKSTKAAPRTTPQGQEKTARPDAAGTVIVQSRGSSGQELRQILARKIDPTSIGVTIRGLYTGPRQLIIRVASKEQAKSLVHSIAEQNIPEVAAKESTGRQKTFVLLGVPANKTAEEAISVLAKTTSVPAENISLRTTLATRKEGSDLRNLVLEAPTQAANKILRAKRICLGLDPCLLKPYLTVQRCFRCQRFGHTQRSCTFQPRCVECGDQHDTLPCHQPKHCVNCQRANHILGKQWATSHSARSSECPAYQEALSCKKQGQEWNLPAKEDAFGEASRDSLPQTQRAEETMETMETSPQRAQTNYEEEEEAPPSPLPPLLKPRRTRIITSPVDETNGSPSPDRPTNPVRPQKDRETSRKRYLTRGRSQEKQLPVATAKQVPAPATIPEATTPVTPKDKVA